MLRMFVGIDIASMWSMQTQHLCLQEGGLRTLLLSRSTLFLKMHITSGKVGFVLSIHKLVQTFVLSKPTNVSRSHCRDFTKFIEQRPARHIPWSAMMLGTMSLCRYIQKVQGETCSRRSNLDFAKGNPFCCCNFLFPLSSFCLTIYFAAYLIFKHIFIFFLCFLIELINKYSWCWILQISFTCKGLSLLWAWQGGCGTQEMAIRRGEAYVPPQQVSFSLLTPLISE